MKNILLFIIILFCISNCTFNKVVKHHGVHSLDKKQLKLVNNISNKNDILSILGSPSTKEAFDNLVWIYIERKYTKASLVRLGKKKLFVNNVLVLEIDNRGILTNKNFYDMNDMNQLTYYASNTKTNMNKNSFVYDFLSSMRQKINDPLGKRKK
tara:strand:+ start:454 stop:915 length:462 start_codon:yes stop_codon:yes gene_type:complete